MSCRPARFLLAALLAAALVPAVAADGNGLALDPDQTPWPRWQGRLAVDAPTALLRRPELTAADAAPTRGLSLMGDYYITGPLLGEGRAGGLRATSALLVGSRGRSLGAGALGLPGGGRGLVVERTLPGFAADDGSATLPYVGIGYTGLAARGGWSFSADLGLVALSPSVRFGPSAAGTPSLDELVRDLRLAPMLQLGVSYSF